MLPNCTSACRLMALCRDLAVLSLHLILECLVSIGTVNVCLKELRECLPNAHFLTRAEVHLSALPSGGPVLSYCSVPG